jgi:hypothetical protein
MQTDFSKGMKGGFLVKRAVKSGNNWKRRYFLLSDNSFTYYVDQKGAKKGLAKGDLLFTPDSTVTSRDVESIAFCFAIVTPDKTLCVPRALPFACSFHPCSATNQYRLLLLTSS